jgi:uncharacterized protein YuzE
MKISYDPEADALYIKMLEGDYECRNVHLSDDITIDFGPNEEFVGIEVLNAKDVLKSGNLPKIVMENVPKEWIKAA